MIEKCLGIHRDPNFRIYIADMLTAFKKNNVNMSLKIHFLHCHLDEFETQSPAESDEFGEKFHQTVAFLEQWYIGKKMDALLVGICWNFVDESDEM